MGTAATGSISSDESARRADAALAALAMTAIAVCVVAGIYVLYSRSFLEFRQVRTEFAFQIPLGPITLLLAALDFLGAYGAIVARKWLYYFPVCLVSLLFMPSIGWSGPGDLFTAIHPLIDLLMTVRLYISMLVWLMVALWLVQLNAAERRRAQS